MLHLMEQEGEIQQETAAARFRDDFFLHALASQNPRLYQELYADYDSPEEWDEIPRTQEDLQAMIAELGEVGIDLNVGTDF